MADEVKENNKQLVCEIKIDVEMMRKIIDEKMTQIELDIQEIRNKAIDEFAERLKEKILEEIDGVSQCQRNYEVESEMSITCSHIMGSLRDVHHRVIDQITKEMRGAE